MPEASDREQRLIALIENVYEINHVFERYIYKSKQFKEFDTEIKRLCKDFDNLQKQYKGLEWEEDVLIPAETIKSRKR
jgi:iron uptake system EfeUOB component EfeO/EfeM